MRMRLITIVTAMLVAVSLSGEARADFIVLDQQASPRTLNFETDIIRDSMPAQTFTVGRRGQLTAVEVFLNAGAFPLVLDIRPTENGVPVEDDARAFVRQTLFPAELPPWGHPAFTTVDLSAANLSVERGDVLAIVLSVVADARNFEGLRASWWGQVFGGYGRGAAFVRGPSFGHPVFEIAPVGGRPDFAFRTFVDISGTPIPEPATILLIASGAVAMLRRARL